MKSNRRKAREGALQILYQLDLNHGLNPHLALLYFENNFSEESGVDSFTHRIVVGVAETLSDLDRKIDEVSEHWRSDRMAVVDRNLLRIGVYELFYCDDIPATVSINEMIELAKGFGSENSAAFVNGILDRLKTKVDRPSKAP